MKSRRKHGKGRSKQEINVNEPIETIETVKPMKHIILDVRYYRRLVEEAPHSIRWFRRVIAIGWNIVPIDIFSSLLILICDFGLDTLGLSANHILAGILPGSMSAHLCFTLVQNVVQLCGKRTYIILAYVGALAFVSIHFLVAREEIWFPFVVTRYAYPIFAEAGVTAVAAWLFMPIGGIEFWLAIVGTFLRIGLGAFLFYLSACMNWGDGLETAVRVIWAAETYHWPDEFVLDDRITNEEWMALMKEYDEAHRKHRPAAKKFLIPPRGTGTE